MKPVLLILIGLILFTCQNRSILNSDENLRELFTGKEIREIDKMVGYVDNMVLKRSNELDVNKAYHLFLDQMNQFIQDSSKIPAPFGDEEKYQFLESLDSSVFNAFWRMDFHLRGSRYRDSIYHNLDNFKSLSFNLCGRYLDYLDKVGKDDTNYKSLKESIELMGDLPASFPYWFTANHQKFDFNIPKNRLWVVAFILRMEEDHYKKMERWLKERNSRPVSQDKTRPVI